MDLKDLARPDIKDRPEGYHAALQVILFAGFFIFQISCANLNIISDAVEADITIQNAEKGSGKKIGKTPYNIDLDELETYVKDGPALITVSKEGFESQSYVIPYFNFADLTIKVNLKKNDKEVEKSARWTLINRLVRIILLAYQSVFRKETEAARNLISGLDQEFPEFAAPWLIRALSAIQEGNRQQARGFLARAQAVDPQDTNIPALIEALKE